MIHYAAQLLNGGRMGTEEMNYPAAKDGWVSDNGLPSPFEQPDFRANRLPTTF